MAGPNEKTPVESPAPKPLVVDADGTLLATDMLFESFWAALGKKPVACLLASLRHFTKPAMLKQKLARLARLDIALLPKRPEVVEYCAAQKAKGAQVIIASGSDKSLVSALSQNLGWGADIFASDGQTNLTSNTKAKALVARFGAGGFDYIGNSSADIAVWNSADKTIIAAPSKRFLTKIKAPFTALGTATNPLDIIKSFRPHQWVKNALLFLPLLAAHRADLAGFAAVFWGVIAFSAAASSIYIINDLLDLAVDRVHKTKFKRPFASGAVPIQTGMIASVALGSFALLGAALLSWQLSAIIALYMALSLAYSLVLKRLRWVDIAVLASLYTLRVVAGSFAAGVDMSGWLAAFIFPIFLALGCVKRLVELGKAENDQILPGRGYARAARGDLLNIAITAAVGAVVVYGLYTYSEIALSLYAKPWEMRLASIPIALWLGRMIWRGWQGRMNYDPIVFAMRDIIGIGLMLVTGLLLLNAAGVIGA